MHPYFAKYFALALTPQLPTDALGLRKIARHSLPSTCIMKMHVDMASLR